ncbi:hypothetical protein [Hymenobacter sp.]|jgi:hypothetical protein|uniref:hypothetical protein n=1 Tax=Hymenobacter sp. TaxID=1898978 RepID=UPI002ED7D3EA
MKAFFALLLAGFLVSACQETPEPALECQDGTVLGTDCGVPTGYFIKISQPIPEARSWVNPTTGATEYIISAINVPVAYRSAGSHIFFTLRRPSSSELAALGSVIALCDQSWEVMYLENAGNGSCATK